MALRLSEAILLGSTMIKPLSGIIISSDGSRGCAFGMAAVAIGKLRQVRGFVPFGERWLATWEGDHFAGWRDYPWVLRSYTPLPCICTHEQFQQSGDLPHGMTRWNCVAERAIIHLFNFHVATQKDWTIERLAQWVASIEPQSPSDFEELPDAVSHANPMREVSV